MISRILAGTEKQMVIRMDTNELHKHLTQQVADAGQQHGLPVKKLKFDTHIFKPDSPKLETVVAVDILREDGRTRTVSRLRAFYSPDFYRYDSAARLEKDIQAYLEAASLIK